MLQELSIRNFAIIDQLELLRMEGGERSLQREIELVGEEMVNQLASDELVLPTCVMPNPSGPM